MPSDQLITEEWLGRILRTYPPETARFLAGEPDAFRNPLGHTLRAAVETLVCELLHRGDRARISAALESIMQIRAVENFAPSRAIEWIFQLKDILRVRLPGPHLDLLCAEIDAMALTAFDLFMKYRERTFEARANEARRRVYVLERRLQPRQPEAWQERGAK